MIGSRIGPRIGPRYGAAFGVGDDELGGASMAGISRDAASLIYCPATSGEWATTLAVAGIGTGGPSLLALLQESSGNAADSIGSFTLTASGTLAYQAAVAGWTRKGIQGTDGVAGILQNTAAGLPDLATTSMLAIAYVSFPVAPASTRTVMQLGSAFTSRTAFAVGTARVEQSNNFTVITSPASAVHPIVVRLNRTLGTVMGCTDVALVAPAFGATPPAGKAFALHGDNTQTWFSDGSTIMYAAAFFGAAAEMTDAKVRTLLQTLGWAPAW